MAIQENNNVTEDQLKAVAITVPKHLPAKCKFCPRSFETGEQIVFGTMKNIQMAFLPADVEKAEPAGLGEQHIIDIINAHLACALNNIGKFRDVTVPGNL